MKARAAQQHDASEAKVMAWKPIQLLRVAALLILAIAISGLMYFYSGKETENMVVHKTTSPAQKLQEAVISDPEIRMGSVAVPKTQEEVLSVSKTTNQPRRRETNEPVVIKEGNPVIAADKVKEPIINGTLCPLEICIKQSVQCSNKETSALAHCSLLQPDESGQIHYAQFDKEAGICEALVEEISIRRISTGETIVLNSSSTPVTAQEFFDYITGKKTGGIEAGVFEADCNNLCLNQSIKLDNRLGNLVLQ
jgi:hypothetical protein